MSEQQEQQLLNTNSYTAMLSVQILVLSNVLPERARPSSVAPRTSQRLACLRLPCAWPRWPRTAPCAWPWPWPPPRCPAAAAPPPPPGPSPGQRAALAPTTPPEIRSPFRPRTPLCATSSWDLGRCSCPWCCRRRRPPAPRSGRGSRWAGGPPRTRTWTALEEAVILYVQKHEAH